MNVLLLTWDFPPARGGIQTWTLELGRRLPGARVRVLAPAASGDVAFDESSGCTVVRLSGAQWGRLPWLCELGLRTVWECLVRRPDLIVCSHWIAAPAALLALWVLRVPYVVFAHGHEVRLQHARRVQRLLFRRARLILCPSNFTRSAVLQNEITPERVRVVSPGVDPMRFAPDADGESDSVAGTILTVSRMTDLYKGHDTVIRALPAILGRTPNAKYVIAGDGPLRERLTQLAEHAGVRSHVDFLGQVSDEAMVDLYRSCDVFALISRESPSDGGAEGFGIVFLEASACGKPVVAGKSGGIPDAVEDGKTGLLVDPEDVDAVAAAITSLLEDPARARAFGEAGRRMVLERFTWERVMQDLRRVLREAAA